MFAQLAEEGKRNGKFHIFCENEIAELLTKN